MMDSAKYPCRFIEKGLTMNMKKGEMIAVMSKHEIEIPNPISTKLVLEKILIILKSIEKQYVIDYLQKARYSVLRLPRYHCILNPLELTRNQLKCHFGHLNVCRSKPSNIVDLIQFICKENVSTENWD